MIEAFVGPLFNRQVIGPAIIARELFLSKIPAPSDVRTAVHIDPLCDCSNPRYSLLLKLALAYTWIVDPAATGLNLYR